MTFALTLRKGFSDPLLHFLILGACLFSGYYLLNGNGPEDPQTIVVDRSHLLNYLEYRSKAFDDARFNAVLNAMPQRDLDNLIKDFVEEEALYREAKALKLDSNDYVARQRLIQQLAFVLEDITADETSPTENELKAYFEEHKADYYVEPTVTFTHVFFSDAIHGERAGVLAEAELKTLNARRVPFNDATAHGDRFLYGVNYVQKGAGLITSHFGVAMTKDVFALPIGTQHWTGPFWSPYGAHLVLVTGKTEGYIPALEEISGRVAQDVLDARKKSRNDAAIASIVKNYKVSIAQLRPTPKNAGS